MDPSEATEVLRIGAALVLAQTRAREAKSRADRCENLVRALATTPEMPGSVADLASAPTLQTSLSSDDWDLLQSIVLEERPSATYSGKVLPPPSQAPEQQGEQQGEQQQQQQQQQQGEQQHGQPADAAPAAAAEESEAPVVATAGALPSSCSSSSSSSSAGTASAAVAEALEATPAPAAAVEASDGAAGADAMAAAAAAADSGDRGDGQGGMLAQWQRWLAQMCSGLQLRALRLSSKMAGRWAASPMGHMLRAETLVGFLVGLVTGALVSRQRHRAPPIAAVLGQQLQRVAASTAQASGSGHWAPVLGNNRAPSIATQQAVARYISAVHAPVSV